MKLNLRKLKAAHTALVGRLRLMKRWCGFLQPCHGQTWKDSTWIILNLWHFDQINLDMPGEWTRELLRCHSEMWWWKPFPSSQHPHVAQRIFQSNVSGLETQIIQRSTFKLWYALILQLSARLLLWNAPGGRQWFPWEPQFRCRGHLPFAWDSLMLMLLTDAAEHCLHECGWLTCWHHYCPQFHYDGMPPCWYPWFAKTRWLSPRV